MKTRFAARDRAFTLIETALAMLAIGLGLLAFFGLGRLGLQSNKESLDDRRCAMLANAIFETLRERNACFVDLARTNLNGQSWSTYWDNARTMKSDSLIAFPPVAGLTPPSSQTNLVFSGAATPAYDPDHISLADWNPRYALVVNGQDASPVAQDWSILRAELHIYPDGDTYSADARIYTTTLLNSGGLP